MSGRHHAPAGPARRGPRVLVATGDGRLRALATLALESDGLEVVAAGARAHVAVVDLPADREGVVETVTALTEEGVRVLGYCDGDDRRLLRTALRAGATGLAWKGDSILALPPAVRRVAADEGYLAPRLRTLLRAATVCRLSPREQEVLSLLSRGLTNDELAAELGLSPETTRTQLTTAMRKLGARNRVHAVSIAYAQGEIALP
jgi:DNA-binding NarL/FixJ family response regulator